MKITGWSFAIASLVIAILLYHPGCSSATKKPIESNQENVLSNGYFVSVLVDKEIPTVPEKPKAPESKKGANDTEFLPSIGLAGFVRQKNARALQ